ncbi:uncharacterized protein N7473_008677 [Penicillium subrubescens]|uniref:DUF7703 domain-containing protein n=1 Tax=Penicillium subrubescens TaxID=1316194 RepID=A0A1Q5U0B7_9EURO|nr:uncharacterized protein N7473_008677 [Penicillium subrubescens]KAJ5886003.1 hypothetical protein N7473_008677 [Penicillium subrubescens]OKP05912.1 hypothetical protein PENSUB_6632 [Penicillium subrubescens]
MDTIMSSLPPDIGAILMKNIGILQVVSMFAIGAYNALETGVVTFDTFKHYRGLYFWSMQVSSWGILLHAIPAMVRFVSVAPNLPMSIPFILGWYAMVTGQALVLYSRLHLVISDINKLSWVLWMIILNALVLHIPMTVLFFGLSQNNAALARPAAIFDRIQLTGFCMQDFIICGIYIREALRALGPVLEVRGKEGRKVIVHLIWVNVLVVILNCLLLITEYKLHYIQVGFKTVVYSIKLKLEFSVLNRLRSLTRTQPCVCQQPQQHSGGGPRRSSDINILDMLSARSRIPRVDIEEIPAFVHVGVSHRSLSVPNSTHDFHEALRETSSHDNVISPVDICVLSPSTLSSENHSRPRIGSSETKSTVEMRLLESPKSN